MRKILSSAALSLALTLSLTAALTCTALAQDGAGVASKVMLRGAPNGVKVAEIRIVRRSDVLVVEADLQNADVKNHNVFYRFRWLDGGGMQVGDGEAWKQLLVYGQQLAVVKSVAPTTATVDFRIEINVE